MNRAEVMKAIVDLPDNNILCLLPTGFGKSRTAIERLATLNPSKILIAIPRLVLIDSWKAEFKKWGYEDLLDKITFTTYVSLHKQVGNYDVAIFDECHHLSEKCQEALTNFSITNSILLSATVSGAMEYSLKLLFKDLLVYKVTTKEAISNQVLPDPTVYLYPLELNNTVRKELIIKGKGQLVECDYPQRWKYLKSKGIELHIKCTEYEYHKEMCNQIIFWKNKYIRTHNSICKNKWLHLCGERLKWLSSLKNDVIKTLLTSLSNERTLTFCNNIEQTEILGKYCINSKNKDSVDILEQFNNGKINHITACNMLNEGMNLTDCQYGIYANLNSSETIVKQRLGRILRHKDPIIIIPFYKETREEELVNAMMEDYNPDLIKYYEHFNQRDSSEEE